MGVGGEGNVEGEKESAKWVVYPFNPSTWETEAGGPLWVQGHPGLQSKFQDTQDCYTEKPCLKQQQQQQQQQWQKLNYPPQKNLKTKTKTKTEKKKRKKKKCLIHNHNQTMPPAPHFLHGLRLHSEEIKP